MNCKRCGRKLAQIAIARGEEQCWLCREDERTAVELEARVFEAEAAEGVTVVPMSDTEGVVNAIAGATGESLIDALARDQDETDFGRLC